MESRYLCLTRQLCPSYLDLDFIVYLVLKHVVYIIRNIILGKIYAYIAEIYNFQSYINFNHPSLL